MSEGGLEATLEGPALCAGLDTLAERARAWTARQAARKAGSQQLSLKKTGAKADAFVRKVG